MQSYVIDMVLCGLAYIILVYFMVILLKKRNYNSGDDDDGGIPFDKNDPDLDLPPGVILPSDSPRFKPDWQPTKDEVLL